MTVIRRQWQHANADRGLRRIFAVTLIGLEMLGAALFLLALLVFPFAMVLVLPLGRPILWRLSV